MTAALHKCDFLLVVTAESSQTGYVNKVNTYTVGLNYYETEVNETNADEMLRMWVVTRLTHKWPKYIRVQEIESSKKKTTLGYEAMGERWGLKKATATHLTTCLLKEGTLCLSQYYSSTEFKTKRTTLFVTDRRFCRYVPSWKHLRHHYFSYHSWRWMRIRELSETQEHTVSNRHFLPVLLSQHFKDLNFNANHDKYFFFTIFQNKIISTKIAQNFILYLQKVLRIDIKRVI